MVSLKKYTKEFIISEMKQRFTKIASLLDDSDYDDMLKQALTWLDQAIFNPREVIIKPEDFILYNGGNFVDVTNLKIDVINNVYYSSESDGQTNFYFPELGILPFITQGTGFATMGSIENYMALKTNLNMMGRQMDLTGDYELWPADENGNRLLQLRHKQMTRIEYLPSIDREADSWVLYDVEYSAFKDVYFDLCARFNAEQQMNATSLGVGKEAKTLVDYYDNKLTKDKEEFSAKALVTYLA